MLKGLGFDVLKLNRGKGKVVLAGELPDRMWETIEVRCWKEYRYLSELWLDENYCGSDNVGYRLIPLTGSAESFGSPVIEFTRGTNGTAKANGIDGPFTTIMDTQSMVVCKKNVTNFMKKLFDELIDG